MHFQPSDGPPVILDIAAATTAEGKLKVARNKGVPVPENTIVDSEGNPTTDADDFYGHEGGFPVGAILPMGGHRGYGLGARYTKNAVDPGNVIFEIAMVLIDLLRECGECRCDLP